MTLRASVVVCLLCGCATGQTETGTDQRNAAVPSAARDRPTAQERPVAIVAGDAIFWDELRPRLIELSGATALEELLLERSLRRELGLAQITIDSAATALEEQSARDALSNDPVRAAQLLEALRSAQGLGATRWQALLWRNAALRALARRDVRMTEAHIVEAFDVAHGPRRTARLLVVADVAAASSARTRIAAGEPFSEVCAQLSTDSSASRGGLLAPIAKGDPSFPPAFRDVLFSLRVGEISQAVLLENGYAIVQLVRETPGDGSDPAATRAECERLARRALERIEMDRIARALVRKATPTLFDESMRASWQWQVERER